MDFERVIEIITEIRRLLPDQNHQERYVQKQVTTRLNELETLLRGAQSDPS